MGPIFWPDPTLLCRFLFLRYSTFINNSVPLKYGLGVTRGHWKRHHSINCEEFLLAYHSNSMALPCTFSEIKQDIGRKSRFLQPTCVRGSLSEYYNNVWYGKTRMAVLWDGENSLRTCLLFSIQYTNVSSDITGILAQMIDDPSTCPLPYYRAPNTDDWWPMSLNPPGSGSHCRAGPFYEIQATGILPRPDMSVMMT